MANIRDLRGLTNEHIDKLDKAGVKTTDDLLERCCEPQGREDISRQTGIHADELRQLAQREELHKVRGLSTGEYDSLLEASGIRTINDLSQQEGSSLYNNIRQINEQRHLSENIPSEQDVTGYINEAKKYKSRIR
jgi:predicted RecB family nuclease